MDLSIIVINWNTLHLLEQCLESIERTIQDLAYETFVVDNASSDGSPGMVRERFPEVRLIENTNNLGFARANNQALPLCQGEYILLLNSDARLSVGTAQEMIRVFRDQPAYGILGPQLVNEDGSNQESYGPMPTIFIEMLKLFGLDKIIGHRIYSHSDDNFIPAFIPTGWVKGACLVIRKKAMKQIGLFDERFFMFNEEIDLCMRAHQLGWEVGFLSNIQVHHLEGGSTGQTPERLLRLYRAKLQYFVKHNGRMTGKVFLTAVQFSSLVKWIFYGLLSSLNPNFAVKRRLWRDIIIGFKMNFMPIKEAV